MNILPAKNESLDWSWDFFPRKPWPSSLPVVVATQGGKNIVVAGFNRKSSELILFIDKPALEILRDLWPMADLGNFERWRFLKVTGQSLEKNAEDLLSLPLNFQNLCDEKQISPKILRPLNFLNSWKEKIIDCLLQLSPTASQVREILEALCDLQFQGKSWEDCEPLDLTADQWQTKLMKMKSPLAMGADKNASHRLGQTPWPKGVSARWERRGDQSGVSLTLRAFSHKDWTKLKAGLEKINLEEDLWN